MQPLCYASTTVHSQVMTMYVCMYVRMYVRMHVLVKGIYEHSPQSVNMCR